MFLYNMDNEIVVNQFTHEHIILARIIEAESNTESVYGKELTAAVVVNRAIIKNTSLTEQYSGHI